MIATPVTSDAPAPPDVDAPTSERPGPRRRFVLTMNPLPIVAGRYGANVEVLLARHHGAIASAYVQTFPAWMIRTIMPDAADANRTLPPMLGGELGYRWYSSAEDASGLFAGPSAVLMPIAYPRLTERAEIELVTLHAWGAAADVGVQAVMASGFTIGGGLGVMAVAYAPPPSATPPAGVTVPNVPEPHVLPRLLLSAGFSF